MPYHWKSWVANARICVLQEYVNGLAMALVGLGSVSDSPSPRLSVCSCF